MSFGISAFSSSPGLDVLQRLTAQGRAAPAFKPPRSPVTPAPACPKSVSDSQLFSPARFAGFRSGSPGLTSQRTNRPTLAPSLPLIFVVRAPDTCFEQQPHCTSTPRRHSNRAWLHLPSKLRAFPRHQHAFLVSTPRHRTAPQSPHLHTRHCSLPQPPLPHTPTHHAGSTTQPPSPRPYRPGGRGRHRGQDEAQQEGRLHRA